MLSSNPKLVNYRTLSPIYKYAIDLFISYITHFYCQDLAWRNWWAESHSSTAYSPCVTWVSAFRSCAVMLFDVSQLSIMYDYMCTGVGLVSYPWGTSATIPKPGKQLDGWMDWWMYGQTLRVSYGAQSRHPPHSSLSNGSLIIHLHADSVSYDNIPKRDWSSSEGKGWEKPFFANWYLYTFRCFWCFVHPLYIIAGGDKVHYQVETPSNFVWGQ